MTDHPLTETTAAALWDASQDPGRPAADRHEEMHHDERATAVTAIRAAFDLGREHERTTNADQDWQEAEKRHTDIAESDAETLYKRCERIREERDVLFRQCEYALDRAEEAEAKLARMDELADRLDDGHLRYLIRNALNGEAHD